MSQFSAEQLAVRRQSLNGSEAGAALGQSPWFTRLDLYRDKMGEGDPIEETLPMRMGTALEPICLEEFEKQTTLVVMHSQRQYYDTSCPWRKCTVDGMTEDADGAAVVEAKTSGDSRGWGEERTDEIPPWYLVNAYHSMLCTGAKRVYFPVIVFRSYKLYVVNWDAELGEMVDAQERQFWEGHVLAKRAPAPTTMEDVATLYPKHVEGKARTANPDVQTAVTRLKGLREEEKRIGDQIDAAKLIITASMGEAEALVAPAGSILATYKHQHRNSYTVKESDFRVLRLK